MNVKDLMTTDLITVHPNDTLADARKQIIKHHIRQVPVTENREVKGILSRTDLIQAFPVDEDELYEWMNPEVSQMMTPDPVCVNENATLEEASQKMYENRIGCLPVLSSDEKLVGILTRTDVFRHIAERDSEN